jgi:ketosteroid isomerase-like protein
MTSGANTMNEGHFAANDAEANKALLCRFHETLFQRRDITAGLELLSDNFVWSVAALPTPPPPGRAGVRAFANLLHGAFSDLQWQTEEPLAQGDRVTARWSMRGTHDGVLWNNGPTRHPIYVTGIHIARIEDGRIAELWQNWGLMGLLQQLGFLPIIGEQTVYPVWDYPEPGSVRQANT